MAGVVLGLGLGVGVVVLTVFGVVLPLMRAQDDSRAKAQVLALKAAAVGAGQQVPEVTSVYDPEPPRRVPARRSVLELGATDAEREQLEAPHPGVMLPRQAPAEQARQFGGW